MLAHSPELSGHVQRLGEYLRYRSAIGVRLTELAILVTAKHYAQPVEWAIHAPIAEREGLAAATVSAIERGERPAPMADDEALVHDFCVELLQGRGQVGDATWARTVGRFGETAVVDLVATCGYWSAGAGDERGAHADVAPAIGLDRIQVRAGFVGVAQEDSACLGVLEQRKPNRQDFARR